MIYLGNYTEDATVYLMFNTFTSDDPSASCTITNFVNTDVHIHKDDGLTQRNNAAGITVSVDFDGITGSHMIKIDTSDDTVAGFWVAGHDYFVRIEGTTVDGATINALVAQFSIENRFNEVDLTKILGHLLTTTGTQLADAFEHFFDVASPTGTVDSLPAAAPDAAGGLPVSDAGGLDIDTKLANTNEVTAARMGALTDWIDGGRLDLLLDALPTAAAIVNEWETQSQADPTGFHVNLQEIGGASIAGNAATLTLKQLDIQNNAGSALIAKSTGGDGHGIDADGNGSGEGISATGGTGGDGIGAMGGSTSGHGINAQGGNSGAGINAAGSNVNAGISATGHGANSGIIATGGANGDGLTAKGGSSSGSGFRGIAQADNHHGMELTKHGTGKDLDADEITTIDTVVDGIQTDLDNATDGLGALKTLIDAVPTASEIQTEMEENGASLLDTIRDDLDNGTDGLGAIKTAIDAIAASALLVAEIAAVTDQTHFTLATGSDIDDAYTNMGIVLYDDTNNDYPCVRKVADYVGATKTVTINSAPNFTLGADDSVLIFSVVPGGTAPTATEIVDEWETQSQADPTGFHVNVKEVNGTAQTAGDIPALVTTVDTVVDGIQTDLNNATDGLGALKTEIDANETKIDTIDTVVDGIQTDLSNATDGLGALKTLIEAVPTASEIQTEMEENGASILDTLQDRLTATRATYLDYLFSIYFGLVSVVAQAQGGAADSITLQAGASAVNDFYKGQLLAIYTGTGAGQARTITGYNGGTKVATVNPNWATAPDNTSWYVVINTGSTVVVDWVDGGRLDLLLDAIKAKTDNLPADPASETNVDANETKIDTLDTVADGIQTDLSNATDGLGALKTLIDAVKTVVDAILADTGTDGVVLKAAGLAADAIDEFHDEVIEGTITHRQAMRILLSALSGKTTGGGTASLASRDVADGKNRISLTVDANGNRTASTVDGT